MRYLLQNKVLRACKRFHRVIVEYTASKTRRSFLFVVLFVLCLLTLALWKMDNRAQRPTLDPSLLFHPTPNNIGTSQPESLVVPTPLPLVAEKSIANVKTNAVDYQTVTSPPTKVGTTPTQDVQTTSSKAPIVTNSTIVTRTKVYPRPFQYLIPEDDLCTSRYPNLFVLIYVHTAPGNFEQRNNIRSTWGNKDLYFRLRTATLFILGKTLDETVASKIKEESQTFHDIIQEDFLDAYKNLTYKGIAALRWITSKCQTPKFVLKVDDDMIVNTFEIVRFLRKAYMKKPETNQFLCLFYNRNMPVMRDVKSKWYVSEQDYPDRMYLPYCSGSAYIFPMSIIPKLYNASFITPFFWVDDVYVTGMLAQNANITHQSIEKLYILYKSPNELSENIVFGSKVFGHFNRKVTKEWSLEFWKNITDIEQWTP